MQDQRYSNGSKNNQQCAEPYFRKETPVGFSADFIIFTHRGFPPVSDIY
jgi:hypothetical protein